MKKARHIGMAWVLLGATLACWARCDTVTPEESAFARLISGDDRSVSERLEHASGMGIQELVSAWRARVMESRPEVTAGLPLSVIVSLLWIALMSFFSLRSTRWRIG